MLLPAYNEEGAIGRVISEVREFLPGSVILVGDNNSTDFTYSEALDKGVEPYRVEKQGKGNVIRELIGNVSTPFALMANADYTYPMSEAPLIYNYLKYRNVEVVITHRSVKEEDSMSYINSLGNWSLSLIASILYTSRIYDVCSGMWGFRSSFLKALDIKSVGFTLEAELFVNVVRSRITWDQIPISYRKRLDGSTPKLKVSDGFRIGAFLLGSRFR